MTDSASGHPDRVLIVRPSALGDVCRTVPCAVSLRRAWPDATIDWVVQDTFIDAVSAHPAVNEIIPFPRSKYGDVWRSAGTLRDFRDWIGGLRERSYDVAFDLQGLGRSALITYLCGARRRIGFSNAREFAWLGYTTRHPQPTRAHIVDQMLELLEHEGIEPLRDMRLYTPQEASKSWAQQRIDFSLDEPYVVFAPTSRHETKRWPQSRWIELIPHLNDRGLPRCVVIGAPSERDQIAGLLDELTQDEQHIDLVGATTVGQTLAVIEHAAIVIANDSAPLHMAVGFDRPLVALFGPTDPAFVGPYGRADSVVRAYERTAEGPVNYRDPALGDSLMQRIEVQQVVDGIDRALERSPRTAGSS